MPTGERSWRSHQDGEDIPRLRIQAVVCDRLRTLRLAGELDLVGRAPLEDAIVRIATDGCTLVLDLRAVTFMDTSGVHVALAADHCCAARGCELRLFAGPAAVQRVFELAGVLAQLPFQAGQQLRSAELPAATSMTERPPVLPAALPGGRAASFLDYAHEHV